jgi:nucleoside-diphosphate-sugar epimerase
LIGGGARVVDDPAVRWSLIERTDVAEAYRLILQTELAESVLMLAEPSSLAVMDVYRAVADCLAVTFDPVSRDELRRHLSGLDYEVQVASQPVDATRAFDRLRWKPQHCFMRRVAELVPGIKARL